MDYPSSSFMFLMEEVATSFQCSGRSSGGFYVVLWPPKPQKDADAQKAEKVLLNTAGHVSFLCGSL